MASTMHKVVVTPHLIAVGQPFILFILIDETSSPVGRLWIRETWHETGKSTGSAKIRVGGGRSRPTTTIVVGCCVHESQIFRFGVDLGAIAAPDRPAPGRFASLKVLYQGALRTVEMGRTRETVEFHFVSRPGTLHDAGVGVLGRSVVALQLIALYV